MLTLTHQNSGGPYLTITKDTVIVGKANNSSWTVSTCDMGGMSYRFSFTVLSGDNAIMIRFSDSSNADHYRSAEGYGVYTYYNNNSQLYYYNDPSGAFLTGKGKGNGTYSVGDLIEIEYSIADGCIKIYKNNTLIVAQKTKYRRYVQFVTSGSLSAESITINYSLNTRYTLCTIDGRKYYANNTGAITYKGIITNSEGSWVGPLLVSTDPEAVKYGTSYDSTWFSYLGTVTYNNTTYYYSNSEYFMPKGTSWSSGFELKEYDNTTISDAALALLADGPPKSRAVNATSFAKYIASCCRYIGNTALTSPHQTDVTKFLLEGIAYPSAAINIKTATRMINKLKTKLKLSTIQESSNQQILSVNTAKILISTYLPTSDIDSFTTFRSYYGSGKGGGAAAVGRFIRIAPTTASSVQLKYTLIGGGGGGSGAICGDGDKNASYTVKSGAGGKGGESKISLNGSVIKTAAGGSGGAAISKKVGGNPSLATNGNSGSAGTNVNATLSIPAIAEILIAIGGGGGGGGGAGCSAGGSTGSKTFTGANGGNATTFDGTTTSNIGGKGGNSSSTVNEWSKDDGVFAGGGGGGGIVGANGTNNYSDNANRCGTKTPAASGDTYLGGRGGYCASGGSNTTNSTTFGAGGKAGKAGIQTDVWCAANGGNGGNGGGFTIRSGSGADALMFYKSS